MMIRPGLIKPQSASGASTTTWQTSGAPSGLTLSNGNLTAQGPFSYWIRASQGVTSGKIYYEAAWSGTLGAQARVGFSTGAASQTTGELGDFPNQAGYTPTTGSVRGPGSTIQTSAVGDRLRICYDLVNGKIYIATNGGYWNNNSSADPAANTGGIALAVSGTMYPAAELFNGGAIVTAYFSSSSWTYAAPSGFSAMP